MKSFEVSIPTRLFFGQDQSRRFAACCRKLGSRPLVVTGGGSVERLGYLELLLEALNHAGLRPETFRGVEPNPHAATIDKGAAFAVESGADFVVALGGGSVMDAAKGICALVATGEKEIWPFVLGGPRAGELDRSIPMAAIPTTAATASEVTPYCVISNPPTNGKSVIAHESFKPHVSWLNPAFTVEIPLTTTQDGAADILSHVFENYFLGGSGSPIADGYCETLMRTVIHSLPRLMRDPADLELRGQLLWASSLALNGLQLAGREMAEFVLHAMEHALSGFYPGLAHGRGLAALFPAYFRWLVMRGRAADRFARFGRRVFDISEEDDILAAEAAVSAFENWLGENGLRQSLPDLGIDPGRYEEIARECVRVYGTAGELNALGALGVADIVEIFRAT